MEGVTILREVVEKNGNPIPYFIFASMFLVILVLYICLTKKEFRENGFIIILIFGMVTLLFFGVFNLNKNKIAPKQYDVLIDDTVTVNEFFEHYELEKVDGKIYTVKEIRSIE